MTYSDAPGAPKRHIEAILMPDAPIGVGTQLTITTEAGLAPDTLRRPVTVEPGKTVIEIWQRLGAAMSDPCEYTYVTTEPIDPPSPPEPSPGSTPYTEIPFDAVLLPEHGTNTTEWRQALTHHGYAPDTLNVLTPDNNAIRIYERQGTPTATPVTYRSTGITIHLDHDETDPHIDIPITKA